MIYCKHKEIYILYLNTIYFKERKEDKHGDFMCRNSYYNGDDTLFCSVMDQKGSVDTQLVNITIKAVNNPPYIVTAHEYFYVDSSEVSRQPVEMHLNNISVGDFDQFDKPGKTTFCTFVVENKNNSINFTNENFDR